MSFLSRAFNPQASARRKGHRLCSLVHMSSLPCACVCMGLSTHPGFRDDIRAECSSDAEAASVIVAASKSDDSPQRRNLQQGTVHSTTSREPLAGLRRLSSSGHSRTSSRGSSPVAAARSREGSTDSRASSAASPTPYHDSGRMASFTTKTMRSGGTPNRSRESSLSRSSGGTPTRSRESSMEPARPNSRTSSGSALSSALMQGGIGGGGSLGDVSLFKANWRTFELFKYLEDDTMNKCIEKMKVKTFNAGDQIIKRGTIGTTMFFIDLGTVRAEIRHKFPTSALYSA